MLVSTCVTTMGAVLSWATARFCSLLLDTAEALRRWRKHRRRGHVDEYFDSRSWHSDTLSDLTPDGEESLVTPLGPEDACDGQRAVGGGFLCGQSKARRRTDTEMPQTLMEDRTAAAGGEAQRPIQKLMCEDTRSRHPQVCSVTWPQGEAESGGVVVTPPGTVNEICSSITFPQRPQPLLSCHTQAGISHKLRVEGYGRSRFQPQSGGDLPCVIRGVAVGSPCSFHNIRGRGEEWGGRAVCLDQITGSKVSVSEQSELRVLHPETVSPQHHPGNITSTQTNQDTGGGDPSGGHRGFSPCGPAPGRLCKTSLSLLSDSNNNNKDGTEGGQRGEGSVCLSGGAHSCDTGDEEIIHPLVEPSTALTYDLLGDVEQLRGDSEVSLSSLDHRWSQEVSTSLESVELRCVRSSCPQVYSEATGDGGGNFESEHPTSKPIQVSFPAPQQQVWGVRGCPPDVSLHLPSVRSLEPIWEAGHETMRPAEDSGDVSNLDMSSPEGQRNRSPPLQRRGLSSTCEELDPHSALDKMIKRSKTKGSKFSVFAKMPSFRKTRGLKGSKSEEASPEGGGEGPLSEQGPHRDNYDDEVFIRGDILNQSVHQAFTSTPYEGEDKDCGLFSSTTHTCHVRQVWGGSEREAGGYSSDTSLLKQIQSPNSHSYKRSKSSDSLNIRMRFAQAHKSLSSLFESRPTDKEQEDQVSMGSDLDSAKNRQTWRRLKKAKEAELLKRTQLGILGSPSSIQTLRHTDPISKRGVPQRGGKDSPHGCRSEGQRRKCPPNGLPAGLCPFSDDSAVPRPATPVQRHFGARPLISIHLPGLGPTQWPVRAPKTLKPASSPLGVSLSLLDTAEHRGDSQSYISLFTIGLSTDLEVAQVGSQPDGLSRARRLMETESVVRASVVGGELRTGCWTEVGGVRGVGHDRQRRWKCWDDLWIEEQKKEKRKEMRGVRGSLCHLHNPTEDQDKVRRHQHWSLLRTHQVIQASQDPLFLPEHPIGLDCLGWRRRISYT
ncbi:hypothetical protein INR49_006972, partial [Caranx melampygus]